MRNKIISLSLILIILFSVGNLILADEKYSSVTGLVADIQKYGNLTMDIKPKALYDAGYELGDILNITFGDGNINAPFCTSYTDVDTGNPIIRDDRENNFLVVAINMGNFSTEYNLNVGDEITFTLVEKEAYLQDYLLRQLTRTNVRSDYSTDSIYANFRNMSTTGINEGVLYRSSSPINNEIDRASYADNLAKAVGIKTILNLADSDQEFHNHVNDDDFNSLYCKGLYDQGKVKCLNMSVDIGGEDFGKKLADGLKFLGENEGPYLIHCNEGKDRAGFVSAVLQCLMGATYEEVVEDYMITYENYYNVQKSTKQYESIAKSNIISSITTIICKSEKDTDIKNVNLVKATEDYLKRIGMTESEINKLKDKLSTNSIYKSPNVSAQIVDVEKSGHVVVNLSIDKFNNAGFKLGDMLTVVFDNGFVIEAPYLDNYDKNPNRPIVVGYKNQENKGICISYEKINEIANIDIGNNVTIMLNEIQGYTSLNEVRDVDDKSEDKAIDIILDDENSNDSKLLEEIDNTINSIKENKKESEEIKYYVVKEGDSLWKIAKLHLGDGLKYKEIYNLNNGIIENPNLIYVGQKLIMPGQ